MKEEYYFSFDEPNLKNKNIICSFYISNIERKRGFFFIADEKDKLVIYYAMIEKSDMMKFIIEYKSSMNLDKDVHLKDIFELSHFIEKYNNKYLHNKILDNPFYIKSIIEKMSKDNIQNADNDVLGLDGFSVELKLKKEYKPFYAWCCANDIKYFYIIDFINVILDELKINKNYRFKKQINNTNI